MFKGNLPTIKWHYNLCSHRIIIKFAFEHFPVVLVRCRTPTATKQWLCYAWILRVDSHFSTKLALLIFYSPRLRDRVSPPVVQFTFFICEMCGKWHESNLHRLAIVPWEDRIVMSTWAPRKNMVVILSKTSIWIIPMYTSYTHDKWVIRIVRKAEICWKTSRVNHAIRFLILTR